MHIETSVLSGDGNVLTATRTHARSPLQNEDVSFFTSNLEHSALPVKNAVPAISNVLADASNQLLKSTNRMSKGLRAFSTGSGEKDKLNYSTQLSDTMLLTQFLVKGVGKSTQLIEKISNLQ